jgi:hypothetical protein
LPACTEPGTTAFALVEIEHVAPAAVLAVAVQGTVTGKEVSDTVAGKVWLGPFSLSVIRS